MNKRTKFNDTYCGEVVVIGFTGDASLIQKYLKKMFGIKQQGKHSLWCKETKFNLEVAPHVIAHIEPFGWTTKKDVISKLNKEAKK